MTHVRRLVISAMLLVQFMTAGMILAPSPVSAQVNPGDYCQRSIGGFFGLPTWYKYLDVNFGGSPCEVTFDAREAQSYVRVAMAVFEILMRIAGMAALAMVMYGAFQFLTSQGEPEKYASARNTITNALIGLVIALFAVTIVNLVGANI